MKKLFKDKGLLATLLLGIFFVFFNFQNHIFHLNSNFFSSSGDGLKGYYCASFHTKYDASTTSFKGMNYPTEENIIYTDSQPLISNNIIVLKPIIDLSDYTVGLINFFMLLNFILTPLLLYLLFKRLKIPLIISIVSAILITYLSPQVVRLQGHFSLSYSFIIISYFYLSLRYLESKNLISFKASFAISSTLFLSLFVHPYFFAMGAIVFFFSFISKLIQTKKILQTSTNLFIHVAIPYLTYTIFLKVTDGNIENRTDYPWGFWSFQSNLSGVFFPFGKPYETLVRLFFDSGDVSWEGVAYVGGAAVLAISFGVGYFTLKHLIKKEFLTQSIEKLKSYNYFTIVILLSGFAGLFLSFGLPFKLDESHEWVKHFSVFKQLRAIGRFNWLFFYSVNIIAILIIAKLFLNKNYFLKSISLALVTLLTVDSYYNFKDIPSATFNKAELYTNSTSFEKTKHIDFSDFQAIVSLPFFHVGSENFTVYAEGDIFYYSSALSLNKGLPMFSSMMSRTPINKSLDAIQKFRAPAISTNTENLTEKDYLVIAIPDLIKNDYEKYIYQNATHIESFDGFELLKLENGYFKNAYHNYKDLMQHTKPQLADVLYSTNFDYCEQTILNIQNSPLTVQTEDKDGDCSLYIWIKGIDYDLIGRSAVEIAQRRNEETISYEYFGLHDHLFSIKENIGLFKFDFHQNTNCSTTFNLLNQDILKHPELCVIRTKIIYNE